MELREVIINLTNGVNVTTGEIFDREILCDNPEISRAIVQLALSTQKNLKLVSKNESTNMLNRKADSIFKELKRWRYDIATGINLPAYYVFTDKVLWSIAEGDVVIKEDLLLIKGISNAKYDLYGEEIYDIIKDFM